MNCLCSTCRLTLIPGGWSAIRKYSKMGTRADQYPEVLVLYRKRDEARWMRERGVFARFRYNDLKGAARDCGGRGPYAN
jgi:hypothetical protein